MKCIATVVAMALTVALTPRAGQAQLAWDAPMLVSSGTPSGVSVLILDPHPGDAVGIMVAWRARRTPGGVGFRAGFAEDLQDQLAFFGGLDFSGLLSAASTDFPLDVVWFTGLGVGGREDFVVSFPLGIALGRVVRSESATFNPYVAPRLVLDAAFGNDVGDNDDVDLQLAIDLGLDLSFDPGWAVRFGASIGDRDALAIGIALGGVG